MFATAIQESEVDKTELKPQDEPWGPQKQYSETLNKLQTLQTSKIDPDDDSILYK